MRYLFTQGRYKDRISAFITVDSPEMDRIVTGGVGSKRYRVTFHGPGGHSFGAFGIVNPMFAMADAIARLGRVKVPPAPKTTYSASVTGGGTSINAIPNAVWTEFDLRSESAAQLANLEQEFFAPVGRGGGRRKRRALHRLRQHHLRGEADRRPPGRPDRAGQRTGAARQGGDRGARLPDAVRILLDRRQHPDEPRHSRHPSAPAARGGRAHSLDEWIDVEPTESIRGMTAGLAALLAVADMI